MVFIGPSFGLAFMTEKKITIVIGKRGSGKSYLVKKMIAKEKNLFVWDLMSEYEQGVIFEQETQAEMIEWWRSHYRRPHRIVYRPLNPNAEIEFIANCIYSLGNVTFVVEEIDSVCTTFDMPVAFHSIIQRGRHKNITLIGVTPAPFGIHRNLTRQAKEIYIFNTNEPRDVQYLTNLLGSAIADKIQSLNQYEYVLWQDGTEGFTIGRA